MQNTYIRYHQQTKKRGIPRGQSSQVAASDKVPLVVILQTHFFFNGICQCHNLAVLDWLALVDRNQFQGEQKHRVWSWAESAKVMRELLQPLKNQQI